MPASLSGSLRGPEAFPHAGQGQTGFTLLEMLMVVLLIGITAAITLPVLSSGDPNTLEVVAGEVAGALRHARDEAIRTGEAHGVTISQTTDKVTVQKWDITANPISVIEVLYHPVRKNPWDYHVGDDLLGSGTDISNSLDAFLYAGIGRRRSLIFDARGLPYWYLASAGSGYRLTDGQVQLSLRGHTRTVVIAPVTGRVTIQ